MSIDKDSIKEYLDEPAAFCCQFPKGSTITNEELVEPSVIEEMIEAGLMKLDPNGLKIGQVLGKTLAKDSTALGSITPDLLVEKVSKDDPIVFDDGSAPVQTESNIVESNVTASQITSGANLGTIKISIADGKGITLEFPAGREFAGVMPTNTQSLSGTIDTAIGEPTLIRCVERKHFKINKIEFSDKTKIEGTTLYLRNPAEICAEAVQLEELVLSLKLEVINADEYAKYSETIMDVQPIATKEEGSEIGSGITRILDGVVMVLTGTDENGVQVGEFGSSEGELERNIMWGRPGAPDRGDILIKTEAVIVAGTNMERRGPLAIHKAVDYITYEIRKALKVADESLVTDVQKIEQYRRPGRKRVLVIKEIMGQGAMHDNLIMPVEPVGTLGGKPNVDLGNLPVILSPTEVLDGGIHALTCIGPASKETSRHYFREPLVIEAMNDPEIDLVGIMFVGSPQANSEKFYVSKRVGMTVEAMNLDGAIVTTEGFGNNHIDFASHIEEIGSRNVPVVGVTYSAVQGALVVGNKYMDALIDNNKSKQGIENEILSNNTLCQEDAIRALALLKTKISGGSIKKAEKKWNPNVKQNNIEIIEQATGKKIKLADNEQILPKSKKRQELYEKE